MKKMFSLILALVLLISCIPVFPASATEAETEILQIAEPKAMEEAEEIEPETTETVAEPEETQVVPETREQPEDTPVATEAADPEEVEIPEETKAEEEAEEQEATEATDTAIVENVVVEDDAQLASTCEHTGGVADCCDPAICELCGEPYGEPDWENHSEEYVLWNDFPATCTEVGYSGDMVCSKCHGAPNALGETLPPAGHSFANGVCTACGIQADDNTVAGLVFQIVDEKTVSIISYTSDLAAKVEIPATIQNLPVTEITSNAFANCSVLESIKIPGSITKIGTYAFQNCKNLSEVTFANGLETIGQYAFQNCASLKAVVLPDSVEDIHSYAFLNCSGLEEITFGTGMTEIGSKAFYGCTGLTKIYAPTLKDWCEIDFSGNYGCPLQQAGELYIDGKLLAGEVVIPDGIEVIAENAFKNQKGITSVVFPASVLEIYNNAFENCTNLSEVTIQGDLESICVEAFKNCALSHIFLPDSLAWIEDGAFSGCTKLSHVLFRGDEAARKNLEIYSDNKPLSNAVWHCNADGSEIVLDSTVLCTMKVYHKCTICNELIGDVIADGKHTFLDNGWTVKQDATCTEAGIEENQCQNCIFSDTREVEALGHTGKSNSCKEQATCERCGEAYTELVNTQHGETEIRNAKQPTLIGWGYSGDTYCKDCGTLLAKGEKLPALSQTHTHSYTETVVAPTYTERGYTSYKCSCGDEYIDETSYTKPLGLPNPVIKASANAKTGGATLTWEHDGKADHYKVYRKTSKSGKYKLLATVEEPQIDVSVKVGKKYYYKVFAVCDADSTLNSGYSNVVTYTGKCAAPVVTVSANTSSGKPYLKWGKVTSAKKYYIYRVDTNGNRTSLGSTTKTYFTDSKAAVGTTYTYQVRAYPSKSTYKGAFSDTVSCLTVCAQPAASISISSATGKPSLSWKKVSGAVSYDIYRADSANGEYVLLTNQEAVSFTDTSAAADTAYWYKVNAIAADASLNSAAATAKKVQVTLARPAVTFGMDSKSGKPKLDWEEVEGAVQYKIYRSSYSKKKYKAIATVTESEYVDTSVKAGKGYYYKVIAIGENSKSAYSSYMKLYAKCAQPVVTVEAGTSSGKPVLNWKKVSGAKKYYIYRVNAAGERIYLKSTTKNYYTDTGAAVGTTYTYQVKVIASKKTYNSAYSDAVSCLCVCAQPAVSINVSSSTGKPALSWKKVSGAVSYDIYRADSANGEYVLLTNQEAVSFSDTSAAADTAYWYKVNAIAADTTLNSAEAAGKKVSTTLARPAVTFGNDTATGKPMLTWEEVEGAVQYKIYRSSYSKKKYKAIATVTEGEYIDTSVMVAKGYYYKVIAIGENAKSAYSSYKKVYGKLAQPQLVVEISADTGKPQLSWDKVSSVKKYYIYRTIGEGQEEYLGSTTKNYYTDNGTQIGGTCTYRVRAIASKSTYNSAYSEAVSCKIVCAKPAVTISLDAATGKPTLSWGAVSGAVSYDVYRADSLDSEFVKISSQVETTYADTSVLADSDYWYKVNAIAADPVLNSEDGTVQQIHTTIPAPVMSITIDSASGKPVISWEAVDSATGYIVYRSKYAAKNYSILATTSELSVTDTSAAAGKGYHYRVVATTETCTSGYSNRIKAYANCAQPVVSSTVDIKGNPVVMWEKVAGAEKYYVYRSSEEGVAPEYIGKTTNYLYYVDTDAKLNHTYYYQVKALPDDKEYAGAKSEIIAIKAQGPEELDLDALEEYGISYGVEKWGFEADRNTHAGYYPGAIIQLTSMEQAKRIIREEVDATAEARIAAGDPIFVEREDGTIGRTGLNVEVKHYTEWGYEPEDGYYTIVVYYGG